MLGNYNESYEMLQFVSDSEFIAEDLRIWQNKIIEMKETVCSLYEEQKAAIAKASVDKEALASELEQMKTLVESLQSEKETMLQMTEQFASNNPLIQENAHLKRKLETCEEENESLKRRLEEACEETLNTFSKQFNAITKSTMKKMLSQKKAIIGEEEEQEVLSKFEMSFQFTNQADDFVLRSDVSNWAKTMNFLSGDHVKRLVEAKYVPLGLKAITKRIRHDNMPLDKKPPSSLIYSGLKRIDVATSSSSDSS